MKPRVALLFLPLLQLHCAATSAIRAPTATTSCTPGTFSDPAREVRLRSLLSHDRASTQLAQSEHIAVCFGSGYKRGVLSGDIAFLDAAARDGELAARLLHLLVHHRDKLGDGCAAGLAAARDSESRATQLEQQLLTQLGLPPIPASTAAESAQDYTQRCRDVQSDGRAI